MIDGRSEGKGMVSGDNRTMLCDAAGLVTARTERLHDWLVERRLFSRIKQADLHLVGSRLDRSIHVFERWLEARLPRAKDTLNCD